MGKKSKKVETIENPDAYYLALREQKIGAGLTPAQADEVVKAQRAHDESLGAIQSHTPGPDSLETPKASEAPAA